MSELKECPFCGDNNLKIERLNMNCWVECLNCYARSSAFISDNSAIDSWISITTNDKIQELIDGYIKSRVVCEVIISDLKKLIKPECE